MYELYELFFELFVPRSVERAADTLISARVLRLIALGALIYTGVFFFWHAVAAQFRWQLRARNGYSCGSSFLNWHSHDRLPNFARSRSDTRKNSFWVALATLILFVFPFVGAPDARTVVDSEPPATADVRESAPKRAPVSSTAASRHAEPTTADTSSAKRKRVKRDDGVSAETAQREHVSDSPMPQQEVATNEARSLPYRTWVDNTGQYRAVAAILAVEGDVVRVRKENGRSASVPLNRLSEDDVRYVRKWLQYQKDKRTAE